MMHRLKMAVSMESIVHFSLETIQGETATVSLKLNNLDFVMHKDGEEGWDIVRLVEGEWDPKRRLQFEKMQRLIK